MPQLESSRPADSSLASSPEIPPSRPPAGLLLLTSLLAACLVVSPLAAQTDATATAPTASAASAASDTAKRPKLTIEERVHETGEVARDKVVEHTFKLGNSGDAPLVIESLIAGPNLEVVSRPATIAPGGTGEIRVKVPLLLDRPLALLKQLELHTNDPETPVATLELRIQSTEYVVSKPGYARWIAVQQEKAGTITEYLVARDGQDFEVLRSSELPLGITSAITSTRKEPSAPREWKVDLTLGANAPVGPIVGTLMLYVTHPKQSIVPIPLSGFMRPVVAVTPPALNVGVLPLTKKESQAFIVKAFSTEPVHVTKVEHDIPGLAPAYIQTMTLGRQYKVKLDFDPATTPKGPLHGTLTIFTDSAKEPKISIPISATIE